jgi:hypothetical protein
MPPNQSRGCTLSSRTRGDTTEPHRPLQRLLEGHIISSTVRRLSAAITSRYFHSIEIAATVESPTAQ